MWTNTDWQYILFQILINILMKPFELISFIFKQEPGDSRRNNKVTKIFLNK